MQGSWFGPLLAALVATACGSGDIAKKHAVPLSADAEPDTGAATFALIGVAGAGTLPATATPNSIVFALDQAAKISFQNGPFEIIDAYGTDGTATVQIPSAGDLAESALVMHVRVFVDLPTSAVQVPCSADPRTGVRYCASTVILTQKEGTPTELDIETALIELDVDGNGVLERLNLFDESLKDIFWRGDASGSKSAELRFEPRTVFSHTDDHEDECEYDCPDDPDYPKEPEQPKEPDYPKEPDQPKEPDYPTQPKPSPAPCCGCCCEDQNNHPHEEPRDPDDPD